MAISKTHAKKSPSQNLLNMAVGATQSQFDRADRMAQGIAESDPNKVAGAVLPRGIFNLTQGGEAKVKTGQKETPLTGPESAVKGSGFQPIRLAESQFKERIYKQGKATASIQKIRCNQLLTV